MFARLKFHTNAISWLFGLKFMHWSFWVHQLVLYDKFIGEKRVVIVVLNWLVLINHESLTITKISDFSGMSNFLIMYKGFLQPSTPSGSGRRVLATAHWMSGRAGWGGLLCWPGPRPCSAPVDPAPWIQWNIKYFYMTISKASYVLYKLHSATKMLNIKVNGMWLSKTAKCHK